MNGKSADVRRAATIADVAREADVSIRTVSRVLNNSPKVGKETRETIERTIERLGFRRSLRARALASGRSFLLGVVQGDHNAHVIGLFQQGIVEICSEAGYELLVHPATAQDPDLTSNIEDFVQRTRIDGLVLLPPLSELPSIPRTLRRLGVAAVGIAAVRVPGYPAMLVSAERTAANEMARYLVGLGHRRIGMITGPMQFYSASEREQGFHEGLAATGIAMPAAYVREGDYGFESGLAAAEALLSLPEPPTAIFAGNDIMAAALLKVAQGRGLSVPDDLSVAGFDDSDIASMISPALTTILRPVLEMAREATERVIALLDGEEDRLPDYSVGLEVIVRQSTAPPRAG